MFCEAMHCGNGSYCGALKMRQCNYSCETNWESSTYFFLLVEIPYLSSAPSQTDLVVCVVPNSTLWNTQPPSLLVRLTSRVQTHSPLRPSFEGRNFHCEHASPSVPFCTREFLELNGTFGPPPLNSLAPVSESKSRRSERPQRQDHMRYSMVPLFLQWYSPLQNP